MIPFPNSLNFWDKQLDYLNLQRDFLLRQTTCTSAHMLLPGKQPSCPLTPSLHAVGKKHFKYILINKSRFPIDQIKANIRSQKLISGHRKSNNFEIYRLCPEIIIKKVQNKNRSHEQNIQFDPHINDGNHFSVAVLKVLFDYIRSKFSDCLVFHAFNC